MGLKESELNTQLPTDRRTVTSTSRFQNKLLQPGLYNGLAMKYIQDLETTTGFKCSSMYEYKPISPGVGFEALLKNISDCAEGGKAHKDANCICDIGAASWFNSESRSHLNIDFVHPFIHDDYRLVARFDATSPSHDGLFFITAFSLAVWGCIFSLLALFTCLRVLDVNYYPFPQSTVPEDASWIVRVKHFFLKRMRSSALDTVRIVIGGEPADCNSAPKSTTRRHILNYGVTLCGLFLILTYEASMTASLVVENDKNVEMGCKSSDDLTNLHINQKLLGIVKGDASELYWNSFHTSICPNGSNSANTRTYDSYGRLMEALASTEEVKYVLLDRATAARYITGKYCTKLVFVGEPFLRRGASIVLPKGSRFTETFNKQTIRLNEMGLLPKIDEFLEDERCTPHPDRPISFLRLRTFFFIAFASCLLVFVEMLVHRQRVDQKSKSAQASQWGSRNKNDLENEDAKRDAPAGNDGSSGSIDLECAISLISADTESPDRSDQGE